MLKRGFVKRLAESWTRRGSKQRRLLHTGHIYVHHTVAPERTGSNTAGIVVGLLDAIQLIKPRLGYFRPIDLTSLEGERVKLINDKFEHCFIDPTKGVDQALACRLLLDDKLDDMLEKIYRAYEQYRSSKDFVVIEGTHLNALGRDANALNAQIASALGAPVFLVTDAKLVGDRTRDRTVEAANCTRLSHLEFSKANVQVSGAIVHGTPTEGGIEHILKPLFDRWKLPFLGSVPQDVVQDYAHTCSLTLERKLIINKHINSEVLERALVQEAGHLSPMQFKNSIFRRAAESEQNILLPEGDEPRTVQAVGFVLRNKLSDVTLLGSYEKIKAVAKQYDVDLTRARIIDPETMDLDKYAQVLFEARKHKGVTLEQAREMVKRDTITLGTCMIAAGDADGLVSGAVHTTANTIRPALQIIKTEPSTPTVSSIFFMCLPDKVLVYGDVAVNASPSSEDLASIAISSAETASAFGIQPKVAMLSYATGDSNSGPLIQKVADAVTIAKQRRPDLVIEGPLQYDAAVNPMVASVKLKGKTSQVAGEANVLIFPDLNCGNISYKAVQQHTKAVAIGPILQGLRKPVNDLSRGCTVEDIAATIAATAVQASHAKAASAAAKPRKRAQA